MKTFELTDKELAAITHAVEMSNDMTSDMLFEDITFNLYPKPNDTSYLTHNEAIQLRKELVESMEKLISIRVVMSKLGLKVNDKGYSV